MYQLQQNGHATTTTNITSSDTHRTGSDSIRTLSTMVADSQPSRIPSEDRVPLPSSAQSGYDNPVMFVPSPPTSANRRNRLPPLS